MLLLRYDPIRRAADAGKDVDVPVHEVVHFVSTRQPEAQKAALSEAFATKCGELPAIAPARLLEEPLAVAHQKMFLARVEPARFDRERGWYGDPWVSLMAKALYEPLVQAHADGRVLGPVWPGDMSRPLAPAVRRPRVRWPDCGPRQVTTRRGSTLRRDSADASRPRRPV